MNEHVTIRRARKEDAPRLREISCLTGNDGNPIAQERCRFFADLWMSPYLKYFFDYIWVAEENGIVMGYLTGAPVTRTPKSYEFQLFLKTLIGRYGWANDQLKFMKRFLGWAKSPIDFFSDSLKETLENEYPAHLHVNLLPEMRGKGVGARLMQEFFAQLTRKNCKCVHLLCGKNPVPFYTKNGLMILEQVLVAETHAVFCLGKKL